MTVLSLAQYVQKYGGSALSFQNDSGIDAATMLAISYNEGGADSSTIAGGPQGSFFGIKSSTSQPSGDIGTWTGPTKEFINGAYVTVTSTFNAYSSFGAAAAGFIQFLGLNSRYQTALQNKGNYASFITALGQAGYATSPTWPNQVISLRNQILPLLGGMVPTNPETPGGSPQPPTPPPISDVTSPNYPGTVGGSSGTSGGSSGSSVPEPGPFSSSTFGTVAVITAGVLALAVGALAWKGRDVLQGAAKEGLPT